MPLHLLLPWLLIIAAPPLLLFLLARRKWMRTKLPPGPRPLPVVGNLHQLGAQPHRSLHRLALEHGPIMYLQLGSVPTVVMSSSEVVQEAFKAHDLALSSRPALYAASRLTYGNLDVAFAPYGDYWRQARKLCMQELLSAKRVQSLRSIREEEVESLVASIADGSSSPAAINLSEMMLTLINKIICRAVFGGSGNGRGSDWQMRFCELITESVEVLGGFCAADFFPWMAWIHRLDGLQTRLDRVFRGLDDFLEKLIEDEGKLIDGQGSSEDMLLQVLLRLHKDPMSTFSSRNHIKAILALCLMHLRRGIVDSNSVSSGNRHTSHLQLAHVDWPDIFVAGTDTSYTTIIWAMSELMLNPNELKTAQNQVRKIIGDKGKVEESNLQSLKYLKSVIKESLRLHPPAPLLVPRETTDMITVNGYDIPQKTRILINTMPINLDERRWTNATEFKPERFCGDVEFGGQDFDMIPFGVGRRICPGLNFAVAIVELALANLLYKFDWELQPGLSKKDLDMEEVFGLTVNKKNPLVLAARPYVG